VEEVSRLQNPTYKRNYCSCGEAQLIGFLPGPAIEWTGANISGI